MKPSDVNPRSNKLQVKNLSLGSVVRVTPSDDWDTPQIVSPPISVAISVFSAGVIALLIWSLTYRFPIATSSTGLLYQAPRLSSVTAKIGGMIEEVHVTVGQEVKKGQQLATLDLIDDHVKLKSARQQSDLADNNELVASNLIPRELKQQIVSARKSLDEINNTLSSQENVLEKKLANLKKYKKLESKGFLSSIELLQYEEDIVNLEAELGKLRAEQNKFIAERESTRRQLATTLNSTRMSLSQARENELLSKNRLIKANGLISPIDGIVVQILKRQGQAVSNGLELFVISPVQSKGIEGAFLVSGEDAAKIKQGDEALISPSSASSQRFGYMKGVVKNISPYPSNLSAFTRFIGSESLAVDVFASQESKLPFLVLVEPVYKNGDLVWNGSKGPTWKIRSGTLAKAKIIYQKRLPLSYVLPWLKSVTGIESF